MSAKVIIMDGAFGTGQYAGVTPIGELLLAGIGDIQNRSIFQTLNTTGAFNFFGPIAGQQFVITSMIIEGESGKTITIYEASSPFTTNIDKTIFKISLRNDITLTIPLSFGGFLPVSEGEYLNALVDTAVPASDVNIIGFYTSIEHNEA